MMRQTKLALALLSAAILAGCGGSTPGPQTLKATYSAQVTFGDSLTDVGTYAVGTVKASGGGKYTINGDLTATNKELTGKNWTELLAAQLGLPAPCAAVTGLDGDASKGFSVPVVSHAGCYGYGQGGARVTNPVGPGNKLTGSVAGQLTYPVAKQIAMHLAAVGGKFKGDELVTITVGGNDALIQLGTLSAGATAAGTAAGNAEGAKVGAATFASTLVGLLASGATSPQTAAQAIGLAMATESARAGSTQTTVVGAAVGAAAIQPGNAAVANPAVYGPMVAKATSDATAAATAAGTAAATKAGEAYFAANAPAAVQAMAQAGAELVALVKTQVIGNGATRVVVNNLPDLADAPGGRANGPTIQALIHTMISAYNGQLSSGLAGESRVLLVDLYSISADQIANPGPYGLSNTSVPACTAGLTSLLCSSATLISGDVSHYMFADDIHPTPFEYRLIAQYVAEQMIIKGWM
jgi:phospholipase/lecithinase/hemolysin